MMIYTQTVHANRSIVSITHRGIQPLVPTLGGPQGQRNVAVTTDLALLLVVAKFPCQFSFHRMLHTHLSSGVGATGVSDVPSGQSLNPTQRIVADKYKELTY